MTPRIIWAAALAAALAGCGASGGSAQNTADTITKAVIANDYGGVTAQMDSALQSKITRASVGTISDKMAALGTYKGLTLLSSDATKSEFTYRADFDKGSMNVVIRLDPDGKAAAYRVFPSS